VASVAQSFSDPLSVPIGKVGNRDFQDFRKRLAIDDCKAPWRLLNLVITARLPLCRMGNDTGAYHVQINVNHTVSQMLPAFDAVAW